MDGIAVHRFLSWKIPFLGIRFVEIQVSSSFMLYVLAGVLAVGLVAVADL